MSYPLPSIFIAPSRRAEVRDDMAARPVRPTAQRADERPSWAIRRRW